MQTYILLLQCLDQKGIVAKVSDFIFSHGGNIITADQHSTDPQEGRFFMRVEFLLDGQEIDKFSLERDFTNIGREFNAQWQIYSKQDILRVGILVSRPGHCLFDLLYLWKSQELRVEIPFIISNCEAHRELVQQFRIPFHYIPADANNRREAELLSLVIGKTDFLVLARYMLILSPDFLRGYTGDIINIHHGFLPSFKGANPYRQALQEGVKVIGATAHFVTEKLDAGPIITQAVEHVSHQDDLDTLIRKGKGLEKRALSQAVLNYIDYRIIKFNNKTIVFE